MPGGTRYPIPLPDQEHRPVPRANVDFEDVKKDIDTLNEDTDLFYNQAARKAKQNRDLTGCYKHAKHFPVVNIRYNGKRQTLGHFNTWAQVSFAWAIVLHITDAVRNETDLESEEIFKAAGSEAHSVVVHGVVGMYWNENVKKALTKGGKKD
ncbi:expressed unknown protein [Seminavis robusta]|nr:expressed unknown protein [Seminavis robusta]|eukprot:Sro40_g024930.1 n/a (152) ;mRNA; r:137165-137693